ncbi:hypothetical protein FQZ97_761100 [compost metagenome]
MPFAHAGWKQLRGGGFGRAQQRGGHAGAVQRQAQRAAHPQVRQEVVARVELEVDAARQGLHVQLEFAVLAQAPEAHRVVREHQIGLAAAGQHAAGLAPRSAQVVHRLDHGLASVVAVETAHTHRLRRVHFDRLVGAGADQALDAAVGRERGRRQDQRAAVGQEGGQGAERLGESEHHLAALRLDLLQAGVAQDPGLRQRTPQAGGHGLGGDGAAVVKAGSRPQRKTPLQTVGRSAPAARQTAGEQALVIHFDQGFGDLQAGEDVAGLGRVEVRHLPGRHDLERARRALGVGQQRPGRR